MTLLVLDYISRLRKCTGQSNSHFYRRATYIKSASSSEVTSPQYDTVLPALGIVNQRFADYLNLDMAAFIRLAGLKLDMFTRSLLQLSNSNGIGSDSDDVSYRSASYSLFSKKRTTDEITGLSNRTRLLEHLSTVLATEGQRRVNVCIAIVELTNFKLVNEALGSKAGDRFLMRLGEQLLNGLSKDYIVARLEGACFGVVATNNALSFDPGRIAKEITTILSAPVQICDHLVTPTACIGIALADKTQTNAEALLHRGFVALGAACEDKNGGHSVFEKDMVRKSIEHLMLTEDVRHAASRDELVLYYQPIVALNAGKIVEVEALIRWRHPRIGLISPTMFIPVAESTGAIGEIGDWVLRTACSKLRSWQEQYPPHAKLRVSVNLSVVQLRSDDFVSRTLQIIKESGVDPSCITFEITESTMLTQPETMIARIALLRYAGIRIAMDDFGIGYSSMSSVAKLPLNVLKVDREFTRNLGASAQQDAVMRCIVQLGRDLNLRVIAEGVETVEQLTALRNFGCDCVQGYLLSEPLDVDHIDDILGPRALFRDLIDTEADQRGAA